MACVCIGLTDIEWGTIMETKLYKYHGDNLFPPSMSCTLAMLFVIKAIWPDIRVLGRYWITNYYFELWSSINDKSEMMWT